MKIEEGKFYKTRDGRKVGPIEENQLLDDHWPWKSQVDVEFVGFDKEGRAVGDYLIGGMREHLDLIAEWTDEPDTPKTWGEMTDAEQRDVSHAAMKGKTIELDAGSFDWAEWDGQTPLCLVHQPIRIKPEPKRETVTLTNFHESARGHILTFTTTDGKPATGEFRNANGDVIKMEELK